MKKWAVFRSSRKRKQIFSKELFQKLETAGFWQLIWAEAGRVWGELRQKKKKRHSPRLEEKGTGAFFVN